MINVSSLIKKSNAFKTFIKDKDNQKLSHAYFFVCQDGEYLTEYLKAFAKELCCASSRACDVCRECKLIDINAHPDVIVYPRNSGQTTTTEDVVSLINESHVKPIELNKKVFIITHAESMTVSAQNKLLKTLEEPPQNVYILLGATSEYPILQTVKSRVKKFEISAFSAEDLLLALSKECSDEHRLQQAIACGDGTVCTALKYYLDDNFFKTSALVLDILVNMKSSRDVLEYSNKILASAGGIEEVLPVLELTLRDMLIKEQSGSVSCFSGQAQAGLEKAVGFNTGALIYALESVTQAQKRKKFNANPTMLTEWLLFRILEGKHKWQKL